jgi:diaminohydroxyphosphoribosylaminopyrimidine deaminase/5-amino-6-(5-phosphoribosylamino)uracil reductase
MVAEQKIIISESDQKAFDERFMAVSLRYAYRHRGLTGTNPAVGTVLVDFSKAIPEIVGVGATAIGGRPHAEAVALKEAGDRARGATAYVSLEPCAHHGGTPPCAEALIKAGVVRVVTAYVDPDQRVDGKGHQMLRDAQITVESGLLNNQAAWDMRGYLSRVKYGRPHVMLKIAMTRDGFMGAHGKGQIKITGVEAKRQTHLMRMQSDAILVGAHTVVEDNPQLSVRLAGLEQFSPKIFVLSNSSLPNDLKLQQGQVTLIGSDRKAHKEWIAKGAGFLGIEQQEGLLCLADMLEDMAALGIASLMVEGGATTAQHFLEAGLVDELVLYEASKKLAELVDVNKVDAIAAPVNASHLDEKWHLVEEQSLGQDLMKRYKYKKDA